MRVPARGAARAGGGGPGPAGLPLHAGPTLHYGLTGGWVQKFKGSYLLCFLHSLV